MKIAVEMKNETVCKKPEEMEHGEEEEEPEESMKWVKHYSSDHQILLVGDGDFSFSLCLANAFGSAANIVATSLDSYDDVTRKYKQAKSNLDQLQKLGACLLHGVDATKMKLHSDLKMRRFDQIIFNFPHAGFYGKEDNLLMIKMHKDLVFGFFKNASCMLRANGEIHVNHKTTTPFNNWNIEKLAMQSFLTLIECSDFKKEDYPGYNNKRGDSNRCDEPFPLGKCSTFKFIYNPKARRNWNKISHTMFPKEQTRLPLQEIQDAAEQFPTPINPHYYPQTCHIPRMNEAMTSKLDLTCGQPPISRDYFNNVETVHKRTPPSVGYHPYAHGINLGSPRSLQPRNSFQSLQPWPTSTNARYSQIDHVGTIDNVPLSHTARNVDYQVFGGSSNYLPEAPCRRAQRSSYFDVGTRDPVPLSHSARNEDYHVYDGSSNYLPEAPYRTVKSSYFDIGTRDTVPLSYGARNEDYQAFGGCPNYLQEVASCRTAQRSSYFDSVRSDFERYITEQIGRRTLNADIYNEPH
ncbi:uncharacterized protein LOC130726023 [Lotus japonicus]|uniref:uncharacterized protein LOC130726023 n=1 Tax=Lotus japonicus TaxID=34305 RepID=UPI002585EBC0|nr:uncharacterized protein LOC130726023 [Lotus japonicus]